MGAMRGCRCAGIKSDVHATAYPEFQMLIILSSRPFANFRQRGWRSPAILLEQIEHGPRLLFEKPLFRVTDNIVVGNLVRHGVATSLAAASTSRADLKNWSKSANFALIRFQRPYFAGATTALGR